jgi:P27 family predicted phage terminase small subunit
MKVIDIRAFEMAAALARAQTIALSQAAMAVSSKVKMKPLRTRRHSLPQWNKYPSLTGNSPKKIFSLVFAVRVPPARTFVRVFWRVDFMGLRGPAPTPEEILRLRGSRRAGTRGDELTPERARPPAIPGLSEAEQEVWDWLAEVLDRLGILTEAEVWDMHRFCVASVRWRRCVDYIARNGMSYRIATKHGFVCRMYPEVAEMHRIETELQRLSDRFGLNPAARTRIRVTVEEPETGLALAARKRYPGHGVTSPQAT